MIPRSHGRCLGLLLAVSGVLLVPLHLASGEISQKQRQFFEENIRPVLVEHCYQCHSAEADEIAGDYTLDTRSGIRDAGASGKPAVVPGEPGQSPLLKALRHENLELAMPPENKLPDAVIANFERWIAMGAPDPRDGDPQSRKRRADAEQAKTHWAFQRPVKRPPPQVERKDWPRSPIDRFVLARLEDERLHPVGDADPRALIRRVYFDLIGLPPSPAEVEAFVNDPSQQAFAEVVDSLLSSPHFGERWGRHWLDLARYAESSGKEFNFTYPHAWPYRDYVIESFNQDKPYDRFVTEQLAGDLLPAENRRERDENRLATGFLAIGPKRHNAGGTTFRMDMVDDQIKATSRTFLGMTAGCARCHDHKFDPIPTEDYYALAGIFLSTETLYGTTKIKYSRHPSDLIPFGPDAQKQHEEYEAHQKRIEQAEKDLDKAEKELKKLEEQAKKEKSNDKKKDSKSEDGKDKSSDDKEADKDKPDKDDEPTLKDRLAAAKAEVEKLKKQVKQLKDNTPEPPTYAMGARDGGKPSDTHVAVGGDPGNKGDTVPRGFLSAVSVKDAPEVGEKSSGRLALARWITDRSNPLTARVMVNRIWQHLFGRGIVSTVNNFGELGRPPSHPQLLDYLAVTFMERNWSVKRLIRSIVLSRTYQLSTRKDPANQKLDPRNVYLWRMSPRRLEVEPLRDAMLAVSGQLDRAPAEGSSVTGLGFQLARGVSNSKLNPDSKRRTVYLPIVRHYIPQMLQEFDFAASSLVVGERAETTTAQQALYLLNNEFILGRAEATARLLLKRHPKDAAARIRLAYQRALSRPPSPKELNAVKKFLQQADQTLKAKYSDAQERQRMALASFVQILFGSAEFRYLIHPPSPAEAASLAEKAGT